MIQAESVHAKAMLGSCAKIVFIILLHKYGEPIKLLVAKVFWNAGHPSLALGMLVNSFFITQTLLSVS